jgi:hypothetical protein
VTVAANIHVIRMATVLEGIGKYAGGGRVID